MTTAPRGRSAASENGLGAPPGVAKGQSLREQVARALRWELFTGEMPPGSTFSVPGLADRFDVSATPVREAVLDLVREELVVALPNRGFQVVTPSVETLRHAMEVRRLLEVPTTRRIAETASRRDVDRLRRLAEATVKAAQTRRLSAFVQADWEFHRTLTGLCGNPVLGTMIEDLRSKARIVAVPLMAVGGLASVAQEHLDLVEAMSAGALDVVERIVNAHIDHTFDHAFDHASRRSPA